VLDVFLTRLLKPDITLIGIQIGEVIEE